MSKQIPEIRFKGFDEEWEQRKLGKVASLQNGYAFKSDFFIDEPSNYVVLTPGSVHVGGGFQHGKGRFYNINGEFPEKFIFKPGDIFLTMTDLTPTAQALGYPAVVPDDGLVYLHNQRLGKLTSFKVDKSFLLQLLRTDNYHNEIASTASGTTVRHSSSKKILSYVLSIPARQEQTKIGKFLSQLDQTISLHQRQLESTKKLKKSMLQKMFPKNDERVPEIRFPGFTDDWEQRKLGEVAEIIGGGTPSTSNEEYWNGEIDWYSPAEIGDQIYVSGSKKHISEVGLQKSSAKILPVGTVLFTSRAGIGNTAILAKEGATNQGFQSILPKEGVLNSYFVYSRTQELKRYGEVNGAGSTFVEVSGKQMAQMPIRIPRIEEQQQIGTFFQQLDATITLHQRQLDNLKNVKKSLLQKMFI